MSPQFDEFVSIVRRLRKECPWDREQTHESLRNSMIEEAYEAVESIDRQDWQALHTELGDVLLNAVFHTILAEEAGTFTLDDVLRSESEKLISRHPHVFGSVEVEGTDEVLRNWEQIKKSEQGRTSALDGVPAALPALQHAERVQAKAARVGFDFEVPDDAWAKVREEVLELDEVKGSDDDRLEAELGDLLFAIVNYARLRGVSAETALRSTNAKFVRRFRHIEERLDSEGRSVEEANLTEMDALWDEAKRLEREGS